MTTSRIIFLLAFIVVTSLSFSAFSQSKALQDKTSIELAQDLQGYWSTQAQITKFIEVLVQKLPVAKRPEARETLTYILSPEKIEELSAEIMAETFTKPELIKLIEFYATPLGRSAENKRVEYQEKLSVEMQKMIEARAQEVYEERNGKQASEKAK